MARRYKQSSSIIGDGNGIDCHHLAIEMFVSYIPPELQDKIYGFVGDKNSEYLTNRASFETIVSVLKDQGGDEFKEFDPNKGNNFIYRITMDGDGNTDGYFNLALANTFNPDTEAFISNPRFVKE